jgi:hypothetical protein
MGVNKHMTIYSKLKEDDYKKNCIRSVSHFFEQHENLVMMSIGTQEAQ